MHGSDFCWCHNPEVTTERRAEVARRGGETHRRRQLIACADIKLADADECKALLAETASRLRRNEIDSRTATAMCSLLRAGLEAVKLVDHERRLAEVEGGQRVEIAALKAALKATK